jgi:hypothetical protein
MGAAGAPTLPSGRTVPGGHLRRACGVVAASLTGGIRWRRRESGAGDEVIMSIAGHVSRAMHVRMEAKRRAPDEIAAPQGAADEKRKDNAERREQAAVARNRWCFTSLPNARRSDEIAMERLMVGRIRVDCSNRGDYARSISARRLWAVRA